MVRIALEARQSLTNRLQPLGEAPIAFKLLEMSGGFPGKNQPE
jgi:hypothetical protein